MLKTLIFEGRLALDDGYLDVPCGFGTDVTLIIEVYRFLEYDGTNVHALELGQCGMTSMVFTCSLTTLSRTLGMRDHGELTNRNASRFQSMEKAFVRTALGLYVFLQYWGS